MRPNFEWIQLQQWLLPIPIETWIDRAKCWTHKFHLILCTLTKQLKNSSNKMIWRIHFLAPINWMNKCPTVSWSTDWFATLWILPSIWRERCEFSILKWKISILSTAWNDILTTNVYEFWVLSFEFRNCWELQASENKWWSIDGRIDFNVYWIVINYYVDFESPTKVVISS